MTGGFATAALHGGNGTGLKIPKLGEFLQEVVTAVEESGQGVGHEQLLEMI
jgi:hypothetical protein